MDRLSTPADFPRRRFLQGTVASGAVAWLGCAPGFEAAAPPAPSTSAAPAADLAANALDEAFEVFAKTGPEYAGELANHGPMAAEALVALGRADAVLPWVEGYRKRLEGRPPAGARVSRANWRDALGDGSRAGAWTAFLTGEVEEHGWRGALGVWVPRLAPGLTAAAAHGILRAAHAARSLTLKDTPQRRRELSEGLGYWAARYLTLPSATAPVAAAKSLPSEAIARVQLLPAERRAHGLITTNLRRLESWPPFASAIALADVDGDPGRFLSDLTRTTARVYLTNVDRGGLFSFLHAITGASAVRLLVPHIGKDDVPGLLRYAWQFAAAVYAANAWMPPGQPPESSAPNRDDLVDRAIRSGDEHAIKLTEACLREFAVDANPAFLLAAAHGVGRLA
jgi:hypothetical protein